MTAVGTTLRTSVDAPGLTARDCGVQALARFRGHRAIPAARAGVEGLPPANIVCRNCPAVWSRATDTGNGGFA